MEVGEINLQRGFRAKMMVSTLLFQLQMNSSYTGPTYPASTVLTDVTLVLTDMTLILTHNSNMNT